MNRVFDYTKKETMEELTPDQREFTAKMIVRDIKQIAERLNISEELAYEAYRRGLLGGDRQLE